ncbi:acetylornithine deacetylase [Flaviflagellibacter deserti]|uniref:Acetylornithine deacetylase n=1 Tax=Flaviflagellibacter deserti TaxID=2267266 RepID=A0ABV9Z3F4_9HYPH
MSDALSTLRLDSASFDAADDVTERTIGILADLVAFETVSVRSNLAAVDYIIEFLKMHGVASRTIPDGSGDKASVLATIGPADKAGIVLSAHTDVVPVEGQSWSTPPFRATEIEGRIYGRGTTDMKGFVAAVLAQVPELTKASLQAPVHIAFSYDEELGCLGAPDLVAEVAALPTVPALCIVGEPTRMRVVCGHKGKVARRITVHGKGGHSAYPHKAASALDAAAEIAVGLRDLARECASAPDSPGYDPPCPTVHVGSLHSGTALNLVPDNAVIEFEIRATPRSDVGNLLRRVDRLIAGAEASLKAAASDARIEVTPLIDYPGLDGSPDSGATKLVADLAEDRQTASTISFGTEAGFYAAAGIPTLVCGPGDIARAHKADEWIGRDELAAVNRMLGRLQALLTDPDWMSSLHTSRDQ